MIQWMVEVHRLSHSIKYSVYSTREFARNQISTPLTLFHLHTGLHRNVLPVQSECNFRQDAYTVSE